MILVDLAVFLTILYLIIFRDQNVLKIVNLIIDKED